MGLVVVGTINEVANHLAELIEQFGEQAKVVEVIQKKRELKQAS